MTLKSKDSISSEKTLQNDIDGTKKKKKKEGFFSPKEQAALATRTVTPHAARNLPSPAVRPTRK
jgi:hypothetical protein